MSTLLLPMLILLSGVLRGASVVDSTPTYEHQDPSTGKTLNCSKCPPGTHMAAHCTPTADTQCLPCKDNYFTELWNYLPRCLYCHNFCTGNQEVEKECSPVSNRVCRCKEGFYWAEDFCVPHSQCAPGSGVQTTGTSQTDTVCEKCSDGYFSSSTSALDVCEKQQECTNGEIALLEGSVNHDTVCGSCESLANGGETLRKFLSGFFGMHKMRVGKMKRFVNRYIHDSGEERCVRDTSSPKQRGPLLDQIREWLLEAPEENLRKMPQMLKASQLNSMAEKLENRFNEIKQQNQNCSLSF